VTGISLTTINMHQNPKNLGFFLSVISYIEFNDRKCNLLGIQTISGDQGKKFPVFRTDKNRVAQIYITAGKQDRSILQGKKFRQQGD
jgi:hypothetical protein